MYIQADLKRARRDAPVAARQRKISYAKPLARRDAHRVAPVLNLLEIQADLKRARRDARRVAPVLNLLDYTL